MLPPRPSLFPAVAAEERPTAGHGGRRGNSELGGNGLQGPLGRPGTLLMSYKAIQNRKNEKIEECKGWKKSKNPKKSITSNKHEKNQIFWIFF